jgi:hypothetical protein
MRKDLDSILVCYSLSAVTVDAMTRAVMAREDVSRHLTTIADSTGGDARAGILVRDDSRTIPQLLHRSGTVQ